MSSYDKSWSVVLIIYVDCVFGLGGLIGSIGTFVTLKEYSLSYGNKSLPKLTISWFAFFILIVNVLKLANGTSINFLI